MSAQEYGKIIARNLRRIASDAGKSQADIARDLKINKATVSSWMNGTRIPRMEKIDMLASYSSPTTGIFSRIRMVDMKTRRTCQLCGFSAVLRLFGFCLFWFYFAYY